MAKHDNMQIKVFIIMVFKDYEAILMQFDSVYKMLNTEKKQISIGILLLIWCRNNIVDIIKIDALSCLEQTSMVRERMTHEIITT